MNILHPDYQAWVDEFDAQGDLRSKAQFLEARMIEWTESDDTDWIEFICTFVGPCVSRLAGTKPPMGFLE